MTWPLTPNITHAGRLDSDDGRFSIWNVAWVARTLVVNPLGLYDANIFYPRRNTLAFSEANIGAGVLAIPAYWMSGGNPYFAHNVVEMLSFVLSLIGTCALVRHLTGNSVAGLVSGLAFAFCGYTFSHIPHIQLLLSAGLPISLLAMHRFIERQTVGRTVTLGLVMAAQALACGAGRDAGNRVLQRHQGTLEALAVLGRGRRCGASGHRHGHAVLSALPRTEGDHGIRAEHGRGRAMVGAVVIVSGIARVGAPVDGQETATVG
jgi:hypothetical protein